MRAAAFDREQDRVFLAEQHQARRDIARRHARLAQAFLGKTVARLQTLDPRELSPGELLRFQVASEIERRAVGETPAGLSTLTENAGGDVAAPSGLLTMFRPEEVARYTSGLGETTLRFKNGTMIRGFGAETPDNLRQWGFDKGWCDEYAAWSRHTAQEVFDVLWFCLREAGVPQVVISTTPKPLPHVKKLVERGRNQQKRAEEGGERPRVVLTRGNMRENDANLSAAAREELEEEYEGTRLGRQELSGELLEDVEGALWKRGMLEVEGFRLRREHLPKLGRVVVAVDPAT
jgi:phage terminase large subunit-like protein